MTTSKDYPMVEDKLKITASNLRSIVRVLFDVRDVSIPFHVLSVFLLKTSALHRSDGPFWTIFYNAFQYCAGTPLFMHERFRECLRLQICVFSPQYVRAFPKSGACTSVVVVGSCVSFLFFVNCFVITRPLVFLI